MESQEQLFDKEALLERVGGDEELAKEIFDIYLDDTPELIQSLMTAFEENNLEDATRHTHSLKGSSANVGAEALRKLSLEIEMACKAEEIDKAKTLSGQLPQMLEDIKSILESA